MNLCGYVTRLRGGLLVAAMLLGAGGACSAAYGNGWFCSNGYCTGGGLSRCAAQQKWSCGGAICSSPELYTCIGCQCQANPISGMCNCTP